MTMKPLRGGTWSNSDPRFIRCAMTYVRDPASRFGIFGFRPVVGEQARVMRGSAWPFVLGTARCAFRLPMPFAVAGPFHGFRPVVEDP
jgi:formylglycine-generating enzyme required for sulfatase activity